MLDIIKRIYLKKRLGSFGENSAIPLRGMKNTLWKNIYIGNHVSVAPGVRMGATEKTKIILKDGVILAPNVILMTRSHNYDSEDLKAVPYDNMYLAGDIIIEEGVWIGQNVTIVGGVTIGKGAVIGTGCIVTKTVPDYAVCVGNPMVIKKYRNKEKFEQLIKDKKFSKKLKLAKEYNLIRK